MDVVPKPRILICLSHAVVVETRLPDLGRKLQFFPGSVRESSLNELQCLFQCDGRNWSNQKMKVIWHHDKFVQKIFALILIVKQDFYNRVMRSDCSRNCFSKGEAAMK